MVPGWCQRYARKVLGRSMGALPVFLSPESSIHSWSSVYFFSNAVRAGQRVSFRNICTVQSSPLALTANVLLVGALMRST
jgi:hypothetical protein